jgi:hypothetical protein
MADWGKWSQNTGIANKYVQLAPTLKKGRAQAVETFIVGEVKRDQGRRSTQLLDFVVHIFQSTDRACNKNDMSPGGGKPKGDRASNTA